MIDRTLEFFLERHPDIPLPSSEAEALKALAKSLRSCLESIETRLSGEAKTLTLSFELVAVRILQAWLYQDPKSAQYAINEYFRTKERLAKITSRCGTAQGVAHKALPKPV